MKSTLDQRLSIYILYDILSKWENLPMKRLIICKLLLLIGLTMSFTANAQKTEPKKNIEPVQEKQSKPEKPKTYRERYLDYYNPKDYVKNYKERYKPENYLKHYHDLHRENAQQFKNSRKYLKNLSNATGKLIDKAKRLDPMADDIFDRDKQVKKKVDNSDPYIPMPFNNSYDYRDYQYAKRGYASNISRRPYSKYRDSNYSQQLSRLGQLQPNALIDNTYTDQPRNNSLPHTEEVYLPVPMPGPAQAYSGQYIPQQNPYLKYLVGSGQQQIHSATQPTDKINGNLPPAQPIKEKPAELTSDSTKTILPQNYFKKTPIANQQIQRPPSANYQPAPVHLSPAQLLYKQGLQSFAQRNFKKAGQTFEKLVAMNPSAPYVQFAHGLSLFYSSNYNQSLDAFQKSIDLSRQKAMQQPNLWQMNTRPNDFRYHFKKLAKYVENHPKKKQAKELLFLLSKISSKPQTVNR